MPKKQQSFQEWFKANKPVDYVGKRNLGKNPSDRRFTKFQQSTSDRSLLREMYNQGAGPKKLKQAYRTLQRTNANKPGNVAGQTRAFNRNPALRSAYLSQNNLVDIGGGTARVGAKYWTDRAGNVHLGAAPNSQVEQQYVQAPSTPTSAKKAPKRTGYSTPTKKKRRK